jgi:uncharacterized protein
MNHEPSGACGRRSFVKGVGLAGAALLARTQRSLAAADAAVKSTGDIPRRAFGKTGEQVSVIGLGGHTIGLAKDEAEAARIVQGAVDAGINFLDNAYEYHDGKSEEWMGRALVGRRDKVFLMTKVCTHGRDAGEAMRQLEESLRRLKTDHLDLWQVHECIYENDPERHFAKGGVIEALEQAKRDGKVRFVGFTGHKDPSIHLKMLSYDFPFDSVQMPINCFDASFRSFTERVLPELNRRGIAPIGMKSLGGNAAQVIQGIVTPQEAIRFAMSQPIAVLVSGMDSVAVLEQNLAIARGFQPMTAAEMTALKTRVAQYAADGRYELYKVSMEFDGPPGREQHGFPPKKAMPA